MGVRIIETEKLALFKDYIAADLYKECINDSATYALYFANDENILEGVAVCRLNSDISEIADISIIEGCDYIFVYTQLLNAITGLLKDAGAKALSLTIYETLQKQNLIKLMEEVGAREYSEAYLYSASLQETDANLKRMSGAKSFSSKCSIKPYGKLLGYEQTALKNKLLKEGFDMNQIPELNEALSMVWLDEAAAPKGCILVSDDTHDKSLGVEYLYTQGKAPKEIIALMQEAIKAAIDMSYASDTRITAVANDVGKNQVLSKLFAAAPETAKSYIIMCQ